MNIPIFKLNFSKKNVEFYQSRISKVFTSKSLSEGKFTNEFVNKFKKKNHSKYAIACSSGTAALQLAFEAINIKNCEVIVPTNTFFGTVNPIIKSGGKAVLCDNEFNSPEISFSEIKRKVTKKTKVICVVHVGGWIHKDILKIRSFCKKKKIYLVEDAAHAHFSNYKNTFSGNFGDIGCFSFFPTKVMTTGEGGMIVTNKLRLYKKMLSLKNFGRSSNDLILNDIGVNFKISEFNSCLGLVELKRVDSRIKKREEITKMYKKLLDQNKYDVLFRKKSKSSHYKCLVKTKIPYLKIKKYLKKRGINLTGKVWEIPLHKQNVFKKSKKIKIFKYPNADEFSKKHFCPPNYPELSLKQIQRICKVLNSIN